MKSDERDPSIYDYTMNHERLVAYIGEHTDLGRDTIEAVLDHLTDFWETHQHLILDWDEDRSRREREALIDDMFEETARLRALLDKAGISYLIAAPDKE